MYHDPETKDNYLEHLELTPNVKETIQKLYDLGLYLVVISANPRSEDVAIEEIKERIKYFAISDLFYSIRSSPGDNRDGKANILLEIINELGLKKEDAVMIGDSYFYDYEAIKKIGVDAF
ncbi:MAG: HAD hydrolase-like protein [Cyanobium sp. MAG06]|nr:HAD hydrolase-like protein [Cyanobium sp. MAG06]